MMRRIRLDIWAVKTAHGLLKGDPHAGFPYLSWPHRKDVMRFIAECDAMGSPITGQPVKLKVVLEELE